MADGHFISVTRMMGGTGTEIRAWINTAWLVFVYADESSTVVGFGASGDGKLERWRVKEDVAAIVNVLPRS